VSEKLQVHESSSLLKFLVANLQAWARNKVKQRLQAGCVEVNGEVVLKHDHALKVGDSVVVQASARKVQRAMNRLDILYSDDDLVAINKPAGLLSVAAGKENKNHALAILRNQLSRPKHPVQLWPVHRLDRDTSGVLLFATSHEMREAVAALWTEAEKTYLAVVEGVPDPSHGTINQPLRLDSEEYHVHVGSHPQAKRAVTHFETVRIANGRALLKVSLETGRQHQIRAHISWLGYPIVGDMRYGKAGPRMGLHAKSLHVTHPKTGARLQFDAETPADFLALLF
jgi:23S rRNA pseudouridine1911/1915/1917 synthase